MTISLRALADAVDAGAGVDAGTEVAGLTHDSQAVQPGHLFVALPGLEADGADYVADAVRRGAVAACVRADAAPRLSGVGVPLLVVEEPRLALARLAAAFYGQPARALRLIGVTGTLGKTSTMTLIQAALAPSDERGVGAIGSLGASVCGRERGRTPCEMTLDLDGMTTPDPPELHRALRAMADDGVRTVVMEVTSHALAQDRVEGLEFELGVITNLVPDEHLEFHATPQDYLRTKARFLDQLAPGAPLIINADDLLVRAMAASALARSARPLVEVTLGEAARVLDREWDAAAARNASVSVEDLRWDASGSAFRLQLRRGLPALDGGAVMAGEIPITLPVLGVQQVMNAALAATAALVVGASHAAVAAAVAQIEPVRRRMELVREYGPRMIDDTTGNPETLRAVFASIAAAPRSGLRVLFGLRGARGVEINRRLAETLVELVLERARHEPVHVVVTWCEDSADSRNRVTPDERDAALGILDAALAGGSGGGRVRYAVEPTLASAVTPLLDGVREDELVLLLGTQGLDRAAELTREALG